MEKIGLIIGETASLPKEIIERFKFFCVPYIVKWEEGQSLVGENVFQKMREGETKGVKQFPKTSQPPPGVFKKIFEEGLNKFDKLVCVTLSSKLSGGFNSALQARNMLKEPHRVFLLDSLNVTIGEGLIDLRVAEMVEEGKSVEEILREFPKIRENTHLFGLIEHPKWLEAGGRITHSTSLLLEKLQKLGIRPLIGVKEGKVKPVALRLKVSDLATTLFKELENQIKKREKLEDIKIAIGHGDNLAGAYKLQEMIEKNLKLKISFINLIDPIIGVHVGPGTLAIAWN